MEAGLPVEVQNTLVDCYNELCAPITVDVVIGEDLEARDVQLVGVFTTIDRANTVAEQLNSDTNSPWLAEIIRVAVDMPRRLAK